MLISNKKQLREVYGWPSGRAKDKVLSALESHSIHFITKSPFFVLSTYNSAGKSDSSPRGGQPGFVVVADKQTILVPDAKGNNRVDSLENIIDTGHVGCLFFIPGINETLRINGTAEISVNSEILNHFAKQKKKPIAVIKIKIEEVFLHCAKAFMRSDLWGESNRQSRPEFPTMGKMLNDQLKIKDSRIESQQEMEDRYKKDL
ncbi:MAG: MSMEG_1061 family FMN-dependent PPOX-type flavoprotein [Crocinitomicaceae bacterium]